MTDRQVHFMTNVMILALQSSTFHFYSNRPLSPAYGVCMYLFDCLSTILRPVQEFFTYMETSGLQNLGLCSALRVCEQGDLYRATPAATRDLGVSGLIRRTAPFNPLLRFARGCGRPILTKSSRVAYSVCISQLIRYARTCSAYENFLKRGQVLAKKL
jgi:hypothetical protein